MTCNSKMAGRRAKWSEIWDSVTLVRHIWGTFDLVGFKVILGSFCALLFDLWALITYMGHPRYIGSSYLAVRHINLTCPYLARREWQVTKQSVEAPGPLVECLTKPMVSRMWHKCSYQ